MKMANQRDNVLLGKSIKMSNRVKSKRVNLHGAVSVRYVEGESPVISSLSSLPSSIIFHEARSNGNVEDI